MNLFFWILIVYTGSALLMKLLSNRSLKREGVIEFVNEMENKKVPMLKALNAICLVPAVNTVYFILLLWVELKNLYYQLMKK